MSTSAVTHPDDLEADATALRRLMENDAQFVQREKRYLRPDGSVAWAKLGKPDRRPHRCNEKKGPLDSNFELT